LYIYFSGQELNFTELKGKPQKKGYKIVKPSKDYPFRKMNQRLKEDKRMSFLRSALN
jgi:hypothetical protein